MFAYSSVPTSVQETLKCGKNVEYINVLYKETDPVIESSPSSACIVTKEFKDFEQAIKDFPIRESDVWVLGYAKTGTTLTSELIKVLLSGLDFEKLNLTGIKSDCYYYTTTWALGKPNFLSYSDIESGNPERRALRTHFPIHLLPTGLLKSTEHKMIYVARNPKDAAVSWFHHFKRINGYQGTMEDLMDCYVQGHGFWGSYFQHLTEYLKLEKVMKNLLVITYEEFLSDSSAVIKKVANFIDVPLSDEDVQKVVQFINFDEMKKRVQRNNGDHEFLRKGEKDSHKKEMSEKHIELFHDEMRKYPEVMKLYPNF